jgi:integrase/recombinase XerD
VGGGHLFNRQGSRKYLNVTERAAFRRSVEAVDDLREKAFCLTLYHTGCRISEALNLTAECVDLSQKCLVFQTLKRRKTGVFRAVPVPDSLATLLGELIHPGEPSSRVWSFSRTKGYRLIKAVMARSGIT